MLRFDICFDICILFMKYLVTQIMQMAICIRFPIRYAPTYFISHNMYCYSLPVNHGLFVGL